jgi:nucleoside-diphosphate-sugar epimerase
VLVKIFVTGASGLIGSALVPVLLQTGHQVVGLARSPSAAEVVTAMGAEVRRGDLDDLNVLRAAADECDGVVHLAFKHDIAFSGGFTAAAQADLLAIQAFGETLRDSGKPLVIASGVGGLAPGRIATERDMPGAGSAASPRDASAAATLAFADHGVRSCVLRLPPTVHGVGDAHGFIPTLIGIAREQQASGYIGDGTSRWPAVHRLDAADLFRLAVEAAPAGSVLHAVADEGVPTRVIAESIGRHLGVAAVSIPADDAGTHFGWIAPILGADIPASSALTRRLLNWEPTKARLVDDLEQGHYFEP